MAVSDDGMWLFFATSTGVRIYPLGSPNAAHSGAGHAGTAFASSAGPAVAAAEVGVASDLFAALQLGARPASALPAGVGTTSAVLPPAGGLAPSLGFEGGALWAAAGTDGHLASLAGVRPGSDQVAEAFRLFVDGEVQDPLA
jgi:hypothetical protein